MSELGKKVEKSIDRLKTFQRDEGYYLAFSGGKDSVVCKALLDMAGVKYDAHYRVTSADPPELVRFIKNQHPDVQFEYPRYSKEYKKPELAGKPITMWNLIPEELFPPSRQYRYCCQRLKEGGGKGRMTVTGVRWSESKNRQENHGYVTVLGGRAGRELGENENFSVTKRGDVILMNDNAESRRLVEQCYRKHKTNVNPIIDWTDMDVWGFIKTNGIPYCSLYDNGFQRLGCIGCPMASKKNREHEFLCWPKYKDSYLRAFDRMLEQRRIRGRPFVMNGIVQDDLTATDIFNWWMNYDILPGQFEMWDEDLET